MEAGLRFVDTSRGDPEAQRGEVSLTALFALGSDDADAVKRQTEEEDEEEQEVMEEDTTAAEAVVVDVYRCADPSRPPVLAIPQTRRGIAFQLWPSALALCRFMEQQQQQQQQHERPWIQTRCIELGAGLGTVGLLAARLGVAKVVLTDLPDVCAHLLANARANFPDLPSKTISPATFQPPEVAQALAGTDVPVVVASLPWGIDGFDMCDTLKPCADIILASDCVYWEHLFEPLLETLRRLCRPDTIVWMSQLRRRKADRRFFSMASHYFTVKVVDEQRLPGIRSSIQVFQLTLLRNKREQ